MKYRGKVKKNIGKTTEYKLTQNSFLNKTPELWLGRSQVATKEILCC